MAKRNDFVHNPSSTTPRRSPRLQQSHNTPNTKSNASTNKSSKSCSIGSRRSPRLNNLLPPPRRSPRLNNLFPSLRRSPRLNNHQAQVNEPSHRRMEGGEAKTKEKRVVSVEVKGSKKGENEERVEVKGSKKGGNEVRIEVKGSKNGENEERVEIKGSRKGENEERVEMKGSRKGENEERVEIGVKRKRGGQEGAKGWTKEQELALHRAYFAAKPSPHFWKKVSKLVPGKSQQDCFDRIHCDHMTPPQPQPRSRAKTLKSSPLHQFSLSASKLLKPFDKTVRRSNVLKPKNIITQKCVEKLLQQHLKVDQDREGDIFSILEPNTDFSTNALQPSETLSTPKQLKENIGFLQSCTKTSSSSHKKPLSRFSSLSITDLVSPPVLKKVKNRVQHEKYVNLLRCREARRRAAHAQMPVTGKIIGEESSIRKKDVVKAAKVALVSEARDAINKFQQSQVNFMGNTCSSDEDNDDGIEFESESQ